MSWTRVKTALEMKNIPHQRELSLDQTLWKGSHSWRPLQKEKCSGSQMPEKIAK